MKPWDLRPARDIDLPYAARLRSHTREQGLGSTLINTLWLNGVRAYLAAAHRLRVIGREHIPADAPFVMVCNHSSHLDALSLSASLPRRLAHRALALAAGDTFFASRATALFAANALNALPIWRDDTSLADLALLRQRLTEDRLIFMLFPEGTRARDGLMKRFRPGLGAFIAGSPVPVLPCYLTGAFQCWPASSRFPRPGRLLLTIGEPLNFENLPNDPRGWKESAKQAEAAVRKLSEAVLF